MCRLRNVENHKAKGNDILEELNVKVGDKLLYRFSSFGYITEGIVTVKRVTPTGRIRIDYNNSQYDKYGREMGRDIWSGRSSLSIPTIEDYKRLNREAIISDALKIVKNLQQNMSYEDAIKILDIFEEDD